MVAWSCCYRLGRLIARSLVMVVAVLSAWGAPARGQEKETGDNPAKSATVAAPDDSSPREGSGSGGGEQRSTPEALAAYTEAAGYQNQKQFDLAIEQWRRFLATHTDDPRAGEARYNLAVCQLQDQKFVEAIEQLEQVVKVEKSFERGEDAWLNLGWARYSLGLRNAPEEFTQAIAAFTSLLEKFPEGKNRDQALFFRGESLYMLGSRPEAVDSYRELIDNYPASPMRADAMYALGVAQEELQKFPQAGEVYDQFLTEFGSHQLATEVRMRKAETILQAGRFAEAEQLFATVAATADFRAVDHARYRQAFCVASQNRLEEAAELFAKLASDMPTSPYAGEAAMAAGRAYFRLKEFAKANEWFTKISQAESPYASEAVHWCARILLNDKKYPEARQLALQALPAAADHPYLISLKLDAADALYEIPDQRAAAVREYAQIAQDYPDHALCGKAIYNAAYGALELADYKQALNYAQRFLAKFESHGLRAEVEKIAAESLLQLGQHDKAAETFQKLAQEDPDSSEVNRLELRRGLTLYLQKNYDEAIRVLQSVIKGSSATEVTAEASYWLGMSYVAQNQFNDAISAFEKSLAAKTDWPQADEVLLNLARTQRRVERVAEAKQTVTKLISSYPQSAVLDQAHFRLAEFHYAADEYGPAIEHYSTVVTNWPQSNLVPFALYGRGWSLLRDQHPERAAADFDELLTRFPQSELAGRSYYARAMARQQAGNQLGALADIEAFLKTAPQGASLADALYVRGLAQVGLKSYPEAAATFRTLLEDAPDYEAADKVLYELGWVYKNLGDEPQAMERFRQLVANHAGSPLVAEAFYHVGENYYGDKKYDDAAVAYGNVRAQTDRADLLEKASYKLGWTFYQQHKYEEALQAFTEQLTKNSTSNLAADARFMRAECLFRLERYQESIEGYLQSRATPPKSDAMQVLTYLHAGQAAAQLKQWEQSLNWTTALADRHPNSAYLSQALYEQGWAQRNLGRLDEALDLFAQACEKAKDEVGARSRFMRGEILFEKKEFDKAIIEFRLVIHGYGAAQAPESIRPWQAKSAFEAGRCAAILAAEQDGRLRSQYLDAARKFFEYVVQQFPQSDESKPAAEQLQRLGG
jgi:TolA-binding protein